MELANTLRGSRSLSTKEHRLADTPPKYWSAARPVFWIGMLVLVPQLIASVINVTYNMTLLELKAEADYQQFNLLVAIYNVVIWAVCVPWIYFIVKPLAAIATRTVSDEPKLRSHLLAVPKKIAAVASVGWFSGIIFFPVMMHLTTANNNLYSHFTVNLLISGLIAIAYSALGTQYYTLRMLYPRLWTNPRDIEQLAPQELAVLPGRVRFLQLFSGMIPLAGALLMVAVALSENTQNRWYLILIGVLIVLGMAGLQVATTVCQRITKATDALIGTR